MTKHKTSRFSIGAWLVLLAALLLLLLSVAQVGYRFTLPTDGWSVYTKEIEGASWFYDQNLVGGASDLHAGDAVLAVDGRSVAGSAANEYIPPPANWQVGETVTYHVLRNRTEMDVFVSIVHWTPAAFFRSGFGSISLALSKLGVLLFLGLGWFTFWRRPEVPSARALLIFSTAVGAAFISSFLPDGLSVQFNQTAFYLTGLFSYIIFGILIAPSLLVFALLFPQPKKIIQRRPWLAFLPFVYGLFLFVFLFLGGRGEVGWVSTLAMILLALLSLVHAGITQRDAVSRAQMRWVIGGFVLGLGLFMINFPLGFGLISDPLLLNIAMAISNLGFIVIGIFLSIAVLRYRLYDIDIIIRKTLQYGVVTAVLALVYFGTVILLQSLVEQAAVEQSPLIIVLSTLLIAALFNPLRRRVQATVDRRFFRQKYDAQQVLAQFALTARDEVEMEALQAELLQVVRETLQPTQLSLWLQRPEGGNRE